MLLWFLLSWPGIYVVYIANLLPWVSVYPIFLWTADGNESPSSSPNSCIQLSSSTGISSSSNLALMDGMLTFHKIRDTRCSRDNKIQIGLFQRATQSRFCSWVTWQIICQCSFCVLLRLASVQYSNYFKLSGPQQAEFGKGLASAKIVRYSFSMQLTTLQKCILGRWYLDGGKVFPIIYRKA